MVGSGPAWYEAAVDTPTPPKDGWRPIGKGNAPPPSLSYEGEPASFAPPPLKPPRVSSQVVVARLIEADVKVGALADVPEVMLARMRRELEAAGIGEALVERCFG